MDNRTWFMAFAPFEHPEISVAVVVSNGESGGGVASPIATPMNTVEVSSSAKRPNNAARARSTRIDTKASVASTAVPIKNVRELIAYAKANPGKLSYGSSGPGTISQQEMELFKQAAGLDIPEIPYKSTAQAMTMARCRWPQTRRMTWGLAVTMARSACTQGARNRSSDRLSCTPTTRVPATVDSICERA